MANKIFRIIRIVFSSLILLIIAAGIVFFGVLALKECTETIEYVISILIIAAAIPLLPVLNPLFGRLGKKAGEKLARILKVTRIVFIVLRVQVLLIVAILLIHFAPKILPEIQRWLKVTFPSPVSFQTKKRINELIDNDSAQFAEQMINEIPNGYKRINRERLIARNIKANLKRAREVPEQEWDYTTLRRIADSFTLFGARRVLENADYSQYKRLKISRYLRLEELKEAFNCYLTACQKTDNCTRISELDTFAKKLSITHPYIFMQKAHQLWEKGNYRQAYRVYKEYYDEMEKTGKASEVPDRITEIVSLPEKFTLKSALKLFRWWLTDAPIYYFDTRGTDQSDPVELDGRSLGYFRLRIDELFAYVNKLRLYTVLFEDKDRPDNQIKADFSIISGINELQSNSAQYQFDYINPAIVNWAYDHLIPNPRDSIGGAPCQLLYDRVFRNFFREKTFCYLFLTGVRDFKNEQKNYRDHFYEKNFYGPDYLREQYGNVFMRNAGTTDFYYAKSIGFWLRRGIDGSADELWRSLKKVMTFYDYQWFAASQSSIAALVGYTTAPEDDVDEYYGEEYEENSEENDAYINEEDGHHSHEEQKQDVPIEDDED